MENVGEYIFFIATPELLLWKMLKIMKFIFYPTSSHCIYLLPHMRWPDPAEEPWPPLIVPPPYGTKGCVCTHTHARTPTHLPTHPMGAEGGRGWEGGKGWEEGRG